MLIAFLSIMLLATLTLFTITRLAVEKIEHHHYLQRADLYRQCKIQKGDIVFLGDSITDGGCWDELFPDMNIKNRGINADDTVGVLARLDDYLEGQPAALFILIGTNDINFWAYRRDSKILANYREILSRCKRITPSTQVFVESILPRGKQYAKHVRSLNIQLEKLAAEFGATYINLYPHFADENGTLKAEYNNDHLHLMAAGYEKWVEILTPYLNNFRKK
jgi:lysophospholipase L1-like esterase